MHFGLNLEAALERATTPKKGQKPFSEAQINSKVQNVMSEWLGEEAVQKKYRDPMVRFRGQ